MNHPLLGLARDTLYQAHGYRLVRRPGLQAYPYLTLAGDKNPVMLARIKRALSPKHAAHIGYLLARGAITVTAGATPLPTLCSHADFSARAPLSSYDSAADDTEAFMRFIARDIAVLERRARGWRAPAMVDGMQFQHELRFGRLLVGTSLVGWDDAEAAHVDLCPMSAMAAVTSHHDAVAVGVLHAAASRTHDDKDDQSLGARQMVLSGQPANDIGWCRRTLVRALIAAVRSPEAACLAPLVLRSRLLARADDDGQLCFARLDAVSRPTQDGVSVETWLQHQPGAAMSQVDNRAMGANIWGSTRSMERCESQMVSEGWASITGTRTPEQRLGLAHPVVVRDAYGPDDVSAHVAAYERQLETSARPSVMG